MTDIVRASRSCELVLTITGWRDVFDEVDVQARDLMVIDKSSKCLVITGSKRAYECFKLGKDL